MNKSTNGRFHRTRWSVRTGLAATTAVAPRLAARIAERLFLTPPRHAGPERERQVLARADAFDVPFRGGRLRAWRFGEGPSVLLVHGWGGRGGQMTAFFPALAEAGCSAVTFDGPAHGASGGRLASVPLFAEAVTAVAEHVGALAAIGHSMGAGATAVAMRDGLWLDAAVFVGPPRSPVAFFRQFCAALDLHPELERAARMRLEGRLGVAMDDLDLPRAAASLATPLLVFHDRGDAEVPWSDGAAIAGAWPGAKLLTTDGLGHRRILRDGAVVAQAASFVAEHLPRCACGRAASEAVGSRRMCARCALEHELFDRSTRWPRAA